jgi:hypothetical protein
MKRYLVVSSVLFVAALLVGALMLTGMSGRDMGPAIFAYYFVIVLGALGANVVIAIALVLPVRARLFLLGAAVLLGALYFVDRVQKATKVKAEAARRAETERRESEWHEKILSLPRAELLQSLKDGSFDARRPHEVAARGALHDRVEAMAESCELDAELLTAIVGREPLSRGDMVNLLDDLRDCKPEERQAWFAHFRGTLFAVSDADERWELARDLLGINGEYLRQFVAAGYRLDAASPSHPPLLFDVLEGDREMPARVRLLIDLGARRDVKNGDGLTAAAFIERRAKEMHFDGELPEEWRATLALLRN